MMMQEVDPRFWVAPMLRPVEAFSSRSKAATSRPGNFQTLGPPALLRTRYQARTGGPPKYSLHSRADGHHHGIVSAVEANGYLYLLSKGAGLLLRVDLAGLKERNSA